jgi:hypothetical protein
MAPWLITLGDRRAAMRPVGRQATMWIETSEAQRDELHRWRTFFREEAFPNRIETLFQGLAVLMRLTGETEGHFMLARWSAARGVAAAG